MTLTTNQEKWLQALESGKYKKGVARLCTIKPVDGVDTEFYCCLGVACEIFQKEAMLTPTTTSGGNKGYSDGGHGVYGAFLPEFMINHLGLNSGAGDFLNPDTGRLVEIHKFGALSSLNDGGFGEHTDFKGIAKAIRENAKYIFKPNDTDI